MPDYHPFNEIPKTPFKQIFTAASADALDLLDNLLKYDPLKRLTAKDVRIYEPLTAREPPLLNLYLGTWSFLFP